MATGIGDVSSLQKADAFNVKLVKGANDQHAQVVSKLIGSIDDSAPQAPRSGSQSGQVLNVVA